MKKNEVKALLRDSISLLLEGHLQTMDLMEETTFKEALEHFHRSITLPDVMVPIIQHVSEDLDLKDALVEEAEALLEQEKTDFDSMLSGVSKLKNKLKKGYH